MTDSRRSSRADRRRGSTPDAPAVDRRQTTNSDIRITAEEEGDELVLCLENPLTAQNCLQAKETALNHVHRVAAKTVVVDLYDVPYIDTTALAVLFDLKKQVTGEGCRFFLQDPSRTVLRMLNLTRMNRVFSVRFSEGDESDSAVESDNTGGDS